MHCMQAISFTVRPTIQSACKTQEFFFKGVPVDGDRALIV